MRGAELLVFISSFETCKIEPFAHSASKTALTDQKASHEETDMNNQLACLLEKVKTTDSKQ